MPKERKMVRLDTLTPELRAEVESQMADSRAGERLVRLLRGNVRLMNAATEVSLEDAVQIFTDAVTAWNGETTGHNES